MPVAINDTLVLRRLEEFMSMFNAQQHSASIHSHRDSRERLFS